MNRFYLNKRGEEKIFSFFWIIMIVLICSSIALAVGIVYSAEVDIQKKEAKILYNKIYDCLIDDGRISYEFLQDNFDIFSECHLNKNIFSEEIFSFRIKLSDEGKKNLIRQEIQEGFPDIEQKCVGIERNDLNPECLKKESLEFYLKGGEIKKGYLEILVASNNKVQ